MQNMNNIEAFAGTCEYSRINFSPVFCYQCQHLLPPKNPPESLPRGE